MALALMLNGNPKVLEALSVGASLQQVLEQLGMRADRIAVERNGEIVPRTRWAQQPMQPDDRLEVVHFVGGGSAHAG